MSNLITKTKKRKDYPPNNRKKQRKSLAPPLENNISFQERETNNINVPEDNTSKSIISDTVISAPVISDLVVSDTDVSAPVVSNSDVSATVVSEEQDSCSFDEAVSEKSIVLNLGELSRSQNMIPEKGSRRRQIDPTTCERDYSAAEIEFMNALDTYKRTSGRMFPTCSEILEVFLSLGYVKKDSLSQEESSGHNNTMSTENQVTTPAFVMEENYGTSGLFSPYHDDRSTLLNF